jgi:GT2 family glycosyltransferase
MSHRETGALASRSYRALRKGVNLLLRGEWGRLKQAFLRRLHPPEPAAVAAPAPVDPYTHWRRQHALTDAARQQMRQEAAAWSEPPLISVLIPVYNIPERYLRLALESVLRQLYPHWELCVADDCSTEPHIRRVLEEYTRRDPRIKVVYRGQNGNISAATNSALVLARGSYLALLDQDDELAEQALFRMAQAIVADPTVDMLYSDEDKLDLEGRHVDPFFKPDWSPEYFLACMYTCHLGVYRTDLVRSIGGFRSEFDTAQDYDLVLRVIAQGARVQHIPDVLYHWRKMPHSVAASETAKPEGVHISRRALRSYLDAIGWPGTVEPNPRLPTFHRVRFGLRGRPRISIIIASACKPVILHGERTYYAAQCIESIRARSTYDNVEILLISNFDIPPELAERLRGWDVRLIERKAPFNWAAMQNQGATAATGEYLLFLNDDMEVITPDWLESLLEFAQLPAVGAVGAKLLYPDGRLQHVGVLLLGGDPCHAYLNYPRDTVGYFYHNVVHRNVMAVTGACLMTRREVFDAVGGFDEAFPLEYNDVDYCLKLATAGRRIVFTPHAELYHYETSTRPVGLADALPRFRERWHQRWYRDPYLNPNLSPWAPDYQLVAGETA